MPTIEVEPGVRLFVQDIGSGDPVVLIPGWAHSHEVWDAQVRALAADYRVVAVDPRGQGKSDRPYGDYSMDRHARDVAIVLERLDLREATVVGWSMGGSIAFKVTADNPGRVKKLVLVASNGVRLVAADDFPFGLPSVAIPQLLEGELTARPQSRKQAMTGAIFAPDDATVDWLVADSLQTPSWAGAASMQGLAEADYRASIGSVKVPVLFVHGTYDALWNVAADRWVAERLENARVVEFADCGHLPHVEHTASFNDHLTQFLKNV